MSTEQNRSWQDMARRDVCVVLVHNMQHEWGAAQLELSVCAHIYDLSLDVAPVMLSNTPQQRCVLNTLCEGEGEGSQPRACCHMVGACSMDKCAALP